ncbi:S26 family signal peptidase [Haloprofundus halobius]|uniref:S26 family signal peptidase n=1 Tax=Haloprofundus halobius TaxID=2876194 RepID=UPI001CCF4697|nr:S26 family signal peptidase [Haloprofundus halobius]
MSGASSGGGSVAREFFGTLAALGLVGAALFAVAGVWPPMVAVESGSMQPNLDRGDLVFVTAVDRYDDGTAGPDGVMTVHEAEASAHERFGEPGDVVVFVDPDGTGAPTLHRAHFWVEEGEDWYGRADRSAIPSGVDDCSELANCPATHAGYVTKGDGNAHYDQAVGRTDPVRTEWVRGKANAGIPKLGWVRLVVAEAV